MAIPGYEFIQHVTEAGGRVLRTRRIADGVPALLRFSAQSGAMRALHSLEREWALFDSLQVAGVPRVLELARGEDEACLALADSGGLPLRSLFHGPVPLARFFDLALELARVLGDLHRQGVAHHGLSPRCVLMTPKTSQVTLLGFHHATRRSSDPEPRLLPTASAEPLAYVSPEQTGRMNRVVDYRTDFYSLGALLYELLTGSLPLWSDDPLELIHAHLAKAPKEPAAFDLGIPEALSGVILRLLAKRAEDRYQSAIGLTADLEQCREDWLARGRITAFPLGRRDVADRFLIPQKLYGRDAEVRTLLEAFDEVCRGRRKGPSLLLVTGYSGIGKTSLIHELYKPIVRERGYFASGKFDQVARSVPFGGLMQAIRALLIQLLTESETRLEDFRSKLSSALAPNAAVLLELLPELELILGPQPEIPALGAQESQNRFQLVFQNLLSALARPEHPVVIFLDDLQWADAATLSLLPTLLTSDCSKSLFLMGAFRDNEVDAAHPLSYALAALRNAGVELSTVALGPLSHEELTEFVSDTLHSTRTGAKPLARLLGEKTDGNPFFVIQFMTSLAEANFLTFDYDDGTFRYRIEDVARAAMTDNVVELMTHKLHRLSPGAQRLATLAACIGSQFDLQTLAVIAQRDTRSLAAELEPAIEAGLLLPAGTSYRFLHDRVQQAAYALSPESERRRLHATVGRLLRSRLSDGLCETSLFDVVDHLNRGREVTVTRGDRLDLAELNHRAGKRAVASTAFDAALRYLTAGNALLAEADWRSHHAFCFDLTLDLAECLLLTQRFEAAEDVLATLAGRSNTALDRAEVIALKLVAHETRGQYGEALESALQGLALFGVILPTTPEQKASLLENELVRIGELLGTRAIAELVELPAMSSPELRRVMNLLMTAWPSAYISGDQPLTSILSAMMVRLSLMHGNCEESAYGYATHAITVGALREEYATAFELGSLALAVNERFSDRRRRAKILQQFQAHTSIWCRPLSRSVECAREVTRVGLETGDFAYAVYGALTAAWAARVATPHVAKFIAEHTGDLELFRRLNATRVADAHAVLLNWAHALQGETDAPTSLSGNGVEESAYEERYRDDPFFIVPYLVTKLELCCLFGKRAQALEIARLGRSLISHLAGTLWPVTFEFWNALAHTSLIGDSERSPHSRDELRRAIAIFEKLGTSCPENYLAQSLLLLAEDARLDGELPRCFELYEQAIRQATEAGPAELQGLSNELCAEAWLLRGQRRIALAFFEEARKHYSEFGARAKAAHLARRLEELGAAAPPRATLAAIATADVSSALKAAQALAAEIELESLVRALLEIAVENAGAEGGALLLEEGSELGVVATAVQGGRDIHFKTGSGATSLPRSIVNYVRRTLESVVLEGARPDDRFAADPYFARGLVAVLCVPVLHKGCLVGVLYLENELAGAFTADRVLLASMLASQAAIAIENARMYATMKQEIGRRALAEQELMRVLSELEALKNRLHAENTYLQEEIRREHNFEEMVGSSAALLEILRQVELVAPTDSTVLVMGETGTGKELVARAIHDRSPRKTRALVKVNCGAISSGLVESELFGHVKGAFTGAIERRVGRFELADGGTLFLDEVGELPLETQVKLLRVLQEGEFEPVGGDKTLRVDVRIIAATNRDLAAAVHDGRFRSDLFYRLNVLRLDVPPLRERDGDVPQLTMYFLSRFTKKFDKPLHAISNESMDLLCRYHWPGNVRELCNVIERAVVLSTGTVLQVDPSQLPEHAPRSLERRVRSAAQRSDGRAPASARPGEASLRDAERTHILTILERTGGVIEGAHGAAALLDLRPSTLRSRMRKLGIR